MSEIPSEDVDLLFPATLDLYSLWNHAWDVDENISEVLRAFPQFSSSRDRLVEEAKRLLRSSRQPFDGEFHLFSEEEDAMIGRVRQAQAVDLAHEDAALGPCRSRLASRQYPLRSHHGTSRSGAGRRRNWPQSRPGSRKASELGL